MYKKLHWTVVALMLIALASPVATAQVASRIAGTVRDSSDAVMNGVKVTVEDINRGISSSTVTNETGRYSFPNMVVGTYRVTAEMAGFKKSSSSEFAMNVNQSMEIDLRWKSASSPNECRWLPPRSFFKLPIRRSET